MPDWSYQTVFKPVLFTLSPKRARDVTFGALQLLSRLPFGSALIQFLGNMVPAEEIHQTISGVEFFSPVGLCGRLNPQLNAIGAMLHFGCGFIEIGPVTLEPIQDGVAQREIHKQHIRYEQIDANIGLEKTYEVLKHIHWNDTKRMVRVLYEGDVKQLGSE